MKNIALAFSIMFLFVFTNSEAQVDTLYSVFEFNIPSQNPWGITYDGESLWISDDQNETIYKASTEGEILDSIIINNAIIKGIEFVNDTLWVLNSEIVGDTAMGNYVFPLFSLYQVDKINGYILDSIIIVSPYTNLASGDLWGLCYNASYFYISYDGGYGPCTSRIDLITGTQEVLCCAHLTGLTSIDNIVWAIGLGDDYIVTSDGEDSSLEYEIDLFTTDLTYDGSHFWVVNKYANTVHQLKQVSLSTMETINAENAVNIYPNPASGYLQIYISPTFIHNLELYNIQGQKIRDVFVNKQMSNLHMNIAGIKRGVYILRINTRIISYKEKVFIR